jgi:CBS domain-containing protein
MFDFDVLGISALDDDRAPENCALGTMSLNVPITDVPRSPALTLPPEATVAMALEAMRRRARNAAVVVQRQRPVGVVSERDVVAHAGGMRDAREAALVTVMSTCPSPLRASDTVGSALRRMCALRQWHLPLVCEQGLLVGAIDVTDLCLWLRDRMTLISVDAALG